MWPKRPLMRLLHTGPPEGIVQHPSPRRGRAAPHAAGEGAHVRRSVTRRASSSSRPPCAAMKSSAGRRISVEGAGKRRTILQSEEDSSDGRRRGRGCASSTGQALAGKKSCCVCHWRKSSFERRVSPSTLKSSRLELRPALSHAGLVQAARRSLRRRPLLRRHSRWPLNGGARRRLGARGLHRSADGRTR